MTYSYLYGTRYNPSMKKVFWVGVAIADILIFSLVAKLWLYL